MDVEGVVKAKRRDNRFTQMAREGKTEEAEEQGVRRRLSFLCRSTESLLSATRLRMRMALGTCITHANGDIKERR
jgi:hypothetical protein